MHVALAYNLKREDDESDPPSTGNSLLNESGVSVRQPGRRPLPDPDRSDVLRIDTSQQHSQSRPRDKFAEWDTVETIDAVRAALSIHHRVSLVEADDQAYRKFQSLQPDIVFNMAEGLKGSSREAQIPAVLELLGVPYTGSDPLTLGICLDKARTKEILSFYRIPTTPFFVLTDVDRIKLDGFEYPLIVKPLHEGSSKGILNSSVVRSPQSLVNEVARVIESYEQPALVEKYLPGREFTVGLLGNGESLRVLPIVESKFEELPNDVNPINSYEVKWIWDTVEHPMNLLECPAKIPLTLRHQLEKLARTTFEVLRCRDWCRIDFRLDASGVPNVMDVNPIPGVLPNPSEHSFYPTAAAAAGLSYNEMINAVLNAALARYHMSH